jgi:hypothetical protein
MPLFGYGFEDRFSKFASPTSLLPLKSLAIPSRVSAQPKWSIVGMLLYSELCL